MPDRFAKRASLATCAVFSTPENDMMAFIDDDSLMDDHGRDECRAISPSMSLRPPHLQNGWASSSRSSRVKQQHQQQQQLQLQSQPQPPRKPDVQLANPNVNNNNNNNNSNNANNGKGHTQVSRIDYYSSSLSLSDVESVRN